MLYTTYYAGSQSITHERYAEMKNSLSIKDAKKPIEAFHLRKLEFLGFDNQKAVPRYFICMKNRDLSQIFLEKKYIQNGMYYKKCAKLTESECRRIIDGDLEWMKNHRKELFADFYRQATLNSLYPGRATDYQREMCRYRKGEYLTFTTSIERAVGLCKDFFKEPEVKISCLDKDKVLMIYKKTASLPQIVSNMLQSQEDTAEDYGFVF